MRYFTHVTGVDSSNRMFFSLLILVHVCVAFPLKCPEPAQWSFRARGHCPDPSKYYCLKNDLINGFSENCIIFDFLQPGRKNVLRGGLDADICSSERYQPWPIKFYTNVSTNCIFLKTACNEEGQLLHGKGNRNTDTTCRCDYTGGYDFLIKPQNLWFCVPSEEDCSCYLKTCQDSRYVLSQDYECINSKKNISMSQCNPITKMRMHIEANQSDTEHLRRRQNTSFLDYFSTGLIIYPKEQLAGEDISISCKMKRKNMPATWYKDSNIVMSTGRMECNDFKEQEHTLKINKAELSDSGDYWIDVKGVKRQIHLQVEDIFSTGLTIYPKEPLIGDDISICCKMKRKNMPATWYKDSNIVMSTGRMECNDFKEQEHTLKINKAELSDSGDYWIDVKGVKRQIHLQVEDHFSNDLTIQPKEPIEGNDISISCKVKRKNISSVWYKNGIPVEGTPRMKFDVKGQKHILTIHKAKVTDSNTYCIEIEGVKKEKYLGVEGYFSKGLKISPKKPIEGNDINIKCTLNKKDIAVIWKKNGNAIDKKLTPVVNDRKYILKIPRAEYVKREIKLDVKDYFSEVLTITPENPIAGNNICITCTVIRKNMSATWSKDGVELSSNDKFKSTAKKRIHTLTVTSAEPNDSGTYCIEVENVKRQKEVKVEEGFSGGLTVEPKEPIEGNDISISCKIKGKNISAAWFKGGVRLKPTDKIKYEVRDQIYTLTICNAELGDSDTYCIEVQGVRKQTDLHVKHVKENKGRRKLTLNEKTDKQRWPFNENTIQS
ncbi:OBSCN [Mytilus coruscus]|uniref:OBSCN n=1 Tax=Mytilus coruscus TaxID=42192 RepID=A0A6J8A6Y0_MYTCO|nr:OBSCN [Mytilus coruscus]